MAMYHRMLLSVILTFGLLASMTTLVMAKGHAGMADQSREETRKGELCMLEAQQVLLDTPVEEWTDCDLETYFFYSLFVVYAGGLTYAFDGHMDEQVNFEALVAQGYIQHWPGNPFNNWEPMTVLSPDDGFIPGELCIQFAPEDFRDGKSMFAFELCVYGPDIAFAALGEAEPMGRNEEWAFIPVGALYMLGVF